MSAWRRVALERFPDRRRQIEAAYSIYDLLRQLEHDLLATYRGERREPELPGRLFDFAAWCFASEQAWALRNAVAVGFYEHMPNTPAGRTDIASRLTFAALDELHPLFRRMLQPPDYRALLNEIACVHGRELPPIGRVNGRTDR